MKIVKILLLFCIVSSVFTQLTQNASQASTSSSGNSDSTQGFPTGQQAQQNTAGGQQPGNTQQGNMPQNGQPEVSQKGGKAKKCSQTQAQQGQMGPNQGQMEQGQTQGQKGQNEGQMGQGQTQGQMSQNEGQTQGQKGQKEGQTQEQKGQNEGQTQEQKGQNEGQTQEQKGQNEGQTQEQKGQNEGQTQEQKGQNEGQTQESKGQNEGQTQEQKGQNEGQTQESKGQNEGQTQEQKGQNEGQTQGQGQGQTGQNQGQMEQGQDQEQKPQGPPQSKGQWDQDTQQQEQCVEVTCADNEIVFKDRCVAQTCENLDRVQAKEEGGKKKLPLKFDGKADFNNNKDVIVQLAFTDNKDKPLIKQDGNANACIERSIYRYRPSFLSETLDDSPITSSYDDNQQLRIWEFTILNADIDNKLFKDEQTDKIVYTGYYSVKLTIQEKKIAQFFFTFFVAVDLNGNIITTQAQSEAQDDTPACASVDNCVSRAETKVGFCSDQTCSTLVDQPQVYAGQNFYVVQRVKQTGFEQWKVGDADITITGDGVNKKLKPTTQEQQPGQTIYTLNVNILANNVEFSVNSKLEDPNAVRRFRFLAASTTTGGTEVSSAKAVGSTTLECIKKDANSSCPSAEEAKAYNQPDCGTIGQMDCQSSNGNIWPFVIFTIIMFLQ